MNVGFSPLRTAPQLRAKGAHAMKWIRRAWHYLVDRPLA